MFIVMDTGAQAPSRKITRLAFMNRLGPDMESVYSLAQTNLSVQIFKDKMLATPAFDLDSQSLSSDFQMLIQAGVLTVERVQEIRSTSVLPIEVFNAQ